MTAFRTFIELVLIFNAACIVALVAVVVTAPRADRHEA